MAGFCGPGITRWPQAEVVPEHRNPGFAHATVRRPGRFCNVLSRERASVSQAGHGGHDSQRGDLVRLRLSHADCYSAVYSRRDEACIMLVNLGAIPARVNCFLILVP
jgi:hypothetical protein